MFKKMYYQFNLFLSSLILLNLQKFLINNFYFAVFQRPSMFRRLQLSFHRFLSIFRKKKTEDDRSEDGLEETQITELGGESPGILIKFVKHI